ncbi:MAG: hypothetical protein LBK66_07535 [Spirochaetaceae bacterium]|nr:hypothetical protein [Spirochaetaceae bacterium]
MKFSSLMREASKLSKEFSEDELMQVAGGVEYEDLRKTMSRVETSSASARFT